jgi:phospholipid/cholesterol/gamma-HCH transport system ATP-binding protein
VITLQGVTKSFREPLLRGVDLELEQGERWGLIGPGASGKSVLLKLICGLLRPDAGSITVRDRPVHRLSEAELMDVRSRVGMLFQNNALYDFMTVLENVAFPLVRAGVARAEAEERAAARLRQVGLSGSEAKLPSAISGGMKKRVGIARASIASPEVVIYDEPTAGLDPVTTSKIYDLLGSDQEQSGATVLVVSSDVEGLTGFAARMAMLHEGRLRYDGPAEGMSQSDDDVVRQFVRGLTEGPL